jgi:uncharacterized membrane protein YesL
MKKLLFFSTFGKTLKKSLQELYNSMGFSILISFMWFLGYLPILFVIYSFWGVVNTAHSTLVGSQQWFFGILSLLVISFWNGLVTGPLTTVFYGLYQIRKVDYPSFKLFLQIVKKVYWRSAGIHWVFSLVVTVLVLNVIVAIKNSNLFIMIPGVLSAYVLFLVLLTSFYFHPLIHLDNSFKKVVKKSFLLVVDNIGLSIWLNVFLGLMLFLSIGLVFPLLLIYGALVIYVVDNGFEPIYQKYEE